MATLARWQRTIVDQAGNVMPGAWIEVRSNTIGGTPLVSLYSDRAGAVPLGNPFQADSNGLAAFHAAGDALRVRAYLGPSGAPTFEQIWPYVAHGTMAEQDADAARLTSPSVLGTMDVQQAIKFTGKITPSQITGTINDYAPTGFASSSIVRISTDTARVITGLAGGVEGREIFLVNVGSQLAVLANENAGSSAANRFAFGGDLWLGASQGCILLYDGTASRWRQVGGVISGAALVSPIMVGTVDVQQAMAISGDITPSQITADQNDYAPTGFSTASVVRVSTDASRNVTGLAGGSDGRAIYIYNVGSFSVVLKDESASSSAANRFGFGADLTLAAKQGASLLYDGTASRWRQVGGPSAGSGVTSVGAGYGISGGTITTTGTHAVSLTSLTNSLGADVALNNTANYFDGPSVAQGSTGTWFVSGTVTMTSGGGATVYDVKLWDGTTVIASGRTQQISGTVPITLSLSGVITSPAGNLRISVKSNSTGGTMKFNVSGNSKDSTVTALRIE